MITNKNRKSIDLRAVETLKERGWVREICFEQQILISDPSLTGNES